MYSLHCDVEFYTGDFFFRGCFLLVLVVREYSVLRTSFKENNGLQLQCAQILISMSRTINPFYLGTLPKAMANLCRGAPNTTEGIEMTLTFPMKRCRRWSGCKKSTKSRLTVKMATVMVERLHLSRAKVKQICIGSSLLLSRCKRRQACT